MFNILPKTLVVNIYLVKGIVHPKMKILSSFTHPQVVPNLYGCVCSAGHKGRYFEECGKQSSSGAPLTNIVFFFLLLWKSMVPQNSLLTNFLQNIVLCVQLNKEIHRNSSEMFVYLQKTYIFYSYLKYRLFHVYFV